MRTARPNVRCLVLGTLLFAGQAHFSAAAPANRLIAPEQPNGHIEYQLGQALNGAAPSEAMQVFVGSRVACCADKTPMAGRYAISGQSIRFKPAFELIEGQAYTVRITHSHEPGDNPADLHEFTLDGAPVAIPAVEKVYPSGDAIPENTLRFHIDFTAPMKPHVSADFIQLVDANGNPDTAAFMAFKQELWSEDRTRLTLLMDPGRIKRGVAQNRELGPALLEDRNYSIVIREGWPSANGNRAAPRFEKAFRVTPALRTRPDPELWSVSAPRSASVEPLVIEFDRPFDAQRIPDAIAVHDRDGKRITGRVSVTDHESGWRFTPDKSWPENAIHLTIDPHLEDVAGNNFREALDQAVTAQAKAPEHTTLMVSLRPSSGSRTADVPSPADQ